MKEGKSVAKSTALLMLGTILSKVLGFLRELVVAYQFGAGSISDAFLLTNGIPSMIFVSLATAISINYIPFFLRLEDKKKQNEFTANIINICFTIMVVGCLGVLVFPRTVLWVFASGLPETTEQYAITMLRIVVFSIIPIILSNILQAYSQANNNFKSTALFGIVVNIVMIGMTMISHESTYYLLSVGTVLANFVGMLIVAWEVRKSGFKYYPIFRIKDENIKAMVLLTLPLMLEDLASNMSLLVDRNLASYLQPGVISGLSYAGTLGNIASTMIASSIITATFPLYSRLIASHDMEQFAIKFKKYGQYLCYILAPISIFIFFKAKDIVIFIFERGAFDGAASEIVWESMACYAIGVLPMGIQSYLIRGFYALQNTKTPVKVKVFSLFCNIGLNLLLVGQWKHMGIAVSTSISYIIAYILLIYILERRYKIGIIRKLNLEILHSIIISVFSIFVINGIFENWVSKERVFLKLSIEGIAFVMIYLLILLNMRKPVKEELKNLLEKRKR